MSKVFRVIKNANYTTLSNYHFKDKRLSWKAKGLLSTMLSLPDDWDFTVEGLATLSGDGVKSTSNGLKELEEYGYLVREQHRNDKGYYAETCYNVYEQPVEKAEESLEREMTIIVNRYAKTEERMKALKTAGLIRYAKTGERIIGERITG